MEDKIMLVVELSKEDYEFIKNLEPVVYDFEECAGLYKIQNHVINSIRAAAMLNNGRCWSCKNTGDWSREGLNKCGECETYVHHTLYEPKE